MNTFNYGVMLSIVSPCAAAPEWPYDHFWLTCDPMSSLSVHRRR
jgi:hypothetical protein